MQQEVPKHKCILMKHPFRKLSKQNSNNSEKEAVIFFNVSLCLSNEFLHRGIVNLQFDLKRTLVAKLILLEQKLNSGKHYNKEEGLLLTKNQPRGSKSRLLNKEKVGMET